MPLSKVQYLEVKNCCNTRSEIQKKSKIHNPTVLCLGSQKKLRALA